jgi:hypothetical protein
VSSEKIYLTKEEQQFLMEMFEVKTATEGAEKFAELMVMERADPLDLTDYLRKIMKKMGITK